AGRRCGLSSPAWRKGKGRILAPCLRRGDGVQSLNYCVDAPVSCIDPQGLRFTKAEAKNGGASHKGISHAFGAPHNESAVGEISRTIDGKGMEKLPDGLRQHRLNMTDAEYRIHKRDAEIFAKKFPAIQPVLEEMAKITGIPLEILVGMGIQENKLDPSTTSAASTDIQGMFQVGGNARDAVSPKSDDEKARRNRIIQKYGDSSLYDGPMYAKQQLEKKGIDLTAPPEKIAFELYKPYLMGPTWSANFDKLAPNDTVDKVFPSKTIKNNAAYFMHEGKVATKQQAEQKLQNFVNSFTDKARIVMKRNEQGQ
ncbi:hypothetical protein, partial [Desulfovibrio cuneatus]|uniref:hypothetical protein n=1 Tax=Desulfovibrio cuneatus TaxID=159728 RepID=UPI001B7FCF2B